MSGKPVGTVWFALAQKLDRPARVPGSSDPVRWRSRCRAASVGRIRAQSCCARCHNPTCITPQCRVRGHVAAVLRAAPAAEQSAALGRTGGAAGYAARRAAGAAGKSARHVVFHRRGGAEETRRAAGRSSPRFVAAARRCGSMHSSTGAKPRRVVCDRRRQFAAAAPARALARASRGERDRRRILSRRQTVPRASDSGAKSSSRARRPACEWPRPLAPAFVVRLRSIRAHAEPSRRTGSIYSVVESWPLDADKSV